MEETKIEQLGKVRNHAQIHQCRGIVGRALAQFFAVDPLGDVYASRRELGVVRGYDNVGEDLHLFLHLRAVVAFEVVVYLCFLA